MIRYVTNLLFCKHFTSFLFEVVQSSCLLKQDQKTPRGDGGGYPRGAYDRCFFVYRQMGLQPGGLISSSLHYLHFWRNFSCSSRKVNRKGNFSLFPKKYWTLVRYPTNFFSWLVAITYNTSGFDGFFAMYPILENNRRFTVKLTI